MGKRVVGVGRERSGVGGCGRRAGLGRGGEEIKKKSPRCLAPAASRRSFVTLRFCALGVPVVLVEVRTPELSSGGFHPFCSLCRGKPGKRFPICQVKGGWAFLCLQCRGPRSIFQLLVQPGGRGGCTPTMQPGPKVSFCGIFQGRSAILPQVDLLTRLPGSWHGGEGLGPAAGPTAGNWLPWHHPSIHASICIGASSVCFPLQCWCLR